MPFAFAILIVTTIASLVIMSVKDDLMFGKNSGYDWRRGMIQFIVSFLIGLSGSLLTLIAFRLVEIGAE